MARKPTYEELEQRLEKLEKRIGEYKQTGAKILALSDIFDYLDTDPDKNIDIVVKQTCEILDGACSLYNRLDNKENSLYAWSGFNLPPDFDREDTPDGHICYEATIKGKDRPVILENLEGTTYEETDPNVKKYGLKSYLGFPVLLGGNAIGSLCVVDIERRRFDSSEISIISILAKAVSLEEERKRVEEELTKYREHLEELVKERTNDLQNEITERKHAKEEKTKLQVRLQRAQKMEAIGTLAGEVAHDLNNVLSGIVSYPELLLMDIPEDNPLRGPLLTIQQSGEKAVTIVQDLLTLARRGVAITEVVNLNDVISEYLKSTEYEKLKSYHPKVEIETNLEAGFLNISGSPVHLYNTIMNLVSNAAEAVADGGKIFVSTENRYIDTPICGYDSIEEGDYIVLTVSDSGTGLSPEDMERIFEPFYTKKVMGKSGTGLGLAVVWGTVKDHKGYIDIQSAEGKGNTFTLYFPIIREELA